MSPSSPAGSADNVSITVSPLSLEAVTNALYRLTVTAGTDTVWTADVNADSYGDGQGAISYVGPCDASQGVNTVSLELLSLEDANGVIDPATYVNPTLPTALTQDILCVENADRPVTFNITVMRDAQQGFFDVAVNFEDLFCSAKVDCADITLVNDPTSGERLPSAVVGIACTGGLGADTHLYMTEMVIKCGDLLIPIPVGDGPGNLYGASGGPAPVAQAMTFLGAEQLAEAGVSYGKIYFNVAMGIDFAALDAADYPSGCTLSFRTTASDGALTDCTTPGNTSFPVLAVQDLPFITAGADTFACGTHPLGSAEFVTTYTPIDTPQAFASEITVDDATAEVTVTACDPAPVVETISVTGVVADDSGTPTPDVTVSFGLDVDYAFNLLAPVLSWTGVSGADGSYLVDGVPMGVALCKVVTGGAIADTQQCGIVITPVAGPVIVSNIMVKAGCIVVAADDSTCDAVDDDCDGLVDEDAVLGACDPCLSNTDCCSGACTAGVCTGAPVPVVVASLTLQGPADLPANYECITEITGNLQIAPDPINGPMPNMNWASLTLAGSMTLIPLSSWDLAHFPALTDVTDSMTIYSNGPISTVSVPALTTIGTTPASNGQITVYGHTVAIDFPALTGLKSLLFSDSFNNLGNDIFFNFPVLTNVEGLNMGTLDASSFVDLPALTNVVGLVQLSPTVTDPTAFSVPMLQSVDYLQLATSSQTPPWGPLWTNLNNFSSLQTMLGLRLRGNEFLTSIALPNVTSITEYIDVDYNINLDTCQVQTLYDQLTSTPPATWTSATGNDTTSCGDISL